MEHKIDLTELTLSLASLMSVTGHTRYSKEKLYEIVSPYFDEIRETRLGCYHLIRRCGKENAQRILVDAHPRISERRLLGRRRPLVAVQYVESEQVYKRLSITPYGRMFAVHPCTALSGPLAARSAP